MQAFHQIDCFSLHFKYWKFLGVYPGKDISKYYKHYSLFFLAFFIILYVILSTINFCFAPAQMELLTEDLIFYFSEMVVISKVLTFIAMKDKILLLLDILESDMFQPNSEAGVKIIIETKKINALYWKIVTALGYFGNCSYTLVPVLVHFIFGTNIDLPICSYYFISETIREKYFYQLYIYQFVGILFHMLIYINVHCFFVGCIKFMIAQLDTLDDNLRKSPDMILEDESMESRNVHKPSNDDFCVQKLNKCIIHFDKVAEFCGLVGEVFSVVVFVSFSVASTTFCVVLFRFTLPSTKIEDYVFLVAYIIMILVGILVPCWLGTQVDAKSHNLTFAAYSCNWTSRSRRFKNSLRIFIERTSRPLTIDGLKMFPLTLVTFTSIMKSAYSFFTLLRFMQSRESTIYEG